MPVLWLLMLCRKISLEGLLVCYCLYNIELLCCQVQSSVPRRLLVCSQKMTRKLPQINFRVKVDVQHNTKPNAGESAHQLCNSVSVSNIYRLIPKCNQKKFCVVYRFSVVSVVVCRTCLAQVSDLAILLQAGGSRRHR